MVHETRKNGFSASQMYVFFNILWIPKGDRRTPSRLISDSGVLSVVDINVSAKIAFLGEGTVGANMWLQRGSTMTIVDEGS